MQQYILGIDIGTGSTKGVAMDLAGKVIGTSQHHYEVYHPEQGFSEQDPELIWEAFVKCIKDISVELGAPPDAISLSSAMHSVIPVDKDGHAISEMMTWADVRSESIATEIRNSPQGESIYHITGTPIHPMSPLCKLIWLRQNREEVFKKTHKFISIKGYIWHKLFNEFQIDYSIASASGLFDIINLHWSAEACQLAGVTEQQLSKPVNTNYSRHDIDPTISILLSIPADTPFFIGASDGCCANLGSHATTPDTAALTIGTSGAVRVTSPVPIYNYSAMTFNYLLDEKTFVSGGAVNNGGNIVDWLLKMFLKKGEVVDQDYEDLFNAIDLIPAGSSGMIFLPYLNGERAPIWDANSSGSFLNIGPEHEQGHFLRAAIEGVCYALNDVLKSLESQSVSIKQLNVSGGFITSKTWLQILADITGKTLFVLQLEDASAIGAIYLAMRELYPGKNYSDNNNIRIEPNRKNHQLYATAFLYYKEIYSKIKEPMKQLHELNF
ncbi:gluconokinase [Mucilaginibacter sp.]|jgi:gluconokinase|uniref:gluconokinase n=1 Tax=Mucilaginibacter sp. TaxID=1882438 RepID=UPI0035690BA9